MELYFADNRPSEESWECQVRIDHGTIVVSYDSDDGLITYQGKEVDTGHFKLDSPKMSGRATLHQMPGEDVLEGFWIEDRYKGMWRIHLDDEED